MLDFGFFGGGGGGGSFTRVKPSGVTVLSQSSSQTYDLCSNEMRAAGGGVMCELVEWGYGVGVWGAGGGCG